MVQKEKMYWEVWETGKHCVLVVGLGSTGESWVGGKSGKPLLMFWLLFGGLGAWFRESGKEG